MFFEKLSSATYDPLLSESETEHRAELDLTELYKKRSTLWSWRRVHIVAFIIYTCIFAFVLASQLRTQIPDRLPLPAKIALKPELRYFTTSQGDANPYTGKPRPELDAAWNRLLHNDNIHVNNDTLTALDLHSVKTKQGDKAIASLGVFHGLHCLKKIRHVMYKEECHQGKSDLATQRESKHADHCVEYIRESLMCKPDPSLVTFQWINDTAQHHDEPEAFNPTNFDSGQHECMNREAIDAWAGERYTACFRYEDEVPDALINRFKSCPDGRKLWPPEEDLDYTA